MPTLLELTDRDYVSYSSASTYLECGEKYRLQKIQRVESSPAFWFAGGSAFHEASELFDVLLETGQTVSAAANAAVEKFHHYLDQAFEQDKDKVWRAGGRATKQWPHKEDGNWWRQEGESMVRTYITWRQSTRWPLWMTPDENLPAIELVYGIDFPGGVKSVGAIDRIFVPEGQMVMLDLKTGSRVPPPIQLGEYAAACEVKWGVRPQVGTFYMARKGETSGMNLLDKYTPEMIGRWKRNVQRGIEAGLFTPHVTNMCGTCDVQAHCYAVSGDVAPPDLNDDMVTSHQEDAA